MTHDAFMWRWSMAVVMAALAPGCLTIVPKQEVFESVVERGESPEQERAPGPLLMNAAASGATITVQLHRERLCVREHYELVEKISGTSARVKINDASGGQIWGGYGAVIALIATVVVLPVSAVVTGLVVAASREKTWREKHVLKLEQRSCDLRGSGTAVRAVAPSGEAYVGTADARGELVFTIRESEPPMGDVTVSAGEVMKVVRYYRDRAACTVERDALYARALAAPPNQRVEELDAIHECGGVPAGDRLERAWLLTRDGVRAAVRGDCRLVALIDPQLAALAADHHARVYLTNPDVQRCRDEKLAATAMREACLQRRVALQRQAQQTSDIKERTRLLTSMPECPAVAK